MSKFVRFLDSEVLQRWAATVATIGFSLVALPSRVGVAVEHPTVWHWVVVVILVGGVASFASEAIVLWRKHLDRRSVTDSDRTFATPEDVPASDVASAVAAIESTPDRISAIKVLREQHPGLGLKAAADLIDKALDNRGE